MNIRQLLMWLSELYSDKEEDGDPEIQACLIWRDNKGRIVNKQYAKFGFNPGFKPELTVEMNTAKLKDE